MCILKNISPKPSDDYLIANNDQGRFFKHLKSTTGLEGKETRSEQVIMDEKARCYGIKCEFVIDGRGRRFVHNLFNTNIAETRPHHHRAIFTTTA